MRKGRESKYIILGAMEALSLRQPWADAVLDGGKDIENRLDWIGSNFRGDFLIHAASGMTRREYDDVVAYVERKGIDWRPKPFDEILRGGIVGVARVADVIMPGGVQHPGVGKGPAGDRTLFAHEKKLSPWYMGGFAFVLRDVQRLQFLSCRGAQRFFKPVLVDPRLRALLKVA